MGWSKPHPPNGGLWAFWFLCRGHIYSLENRCFAYHRGNSIKLCLHGEFRVAGHRPKNKVAIALSQGAYKSSQQWIRHSSQKAQST